MPRPTVLNPARHPASNPKTGRFADPSVLAKGAKPSRSSEVVGREVAHSLRVSARNGDFRLGNSAVWKRKFPRTCAYPNCDTRIGPSYLACFTHWQLVPERLREELSGSLGKPERHEAWQRVKRYLSIRAHLRGDS